MAGTRIYEFIDGELNGVERELKSKLQNQDTNKVADFEEPI